MRELVTDATSHTPQCRARPGGVRCPPTGDAHHRIMLRPARTHTWAVAWFSTVLIWLCSSSDLVCRQETTHNDVLLGMMRHLRRGVQMRAVYLNDHVCRKLRCICRSFDRVIAYTFFRFLAFRATYNSDRRRWNTRFWCLTLTTWLVAFVMSGRGRIVHDRPCRQPVSI